MPASFRALILTDHLAHSADNSIYRLARALALHPDNERVHVASRGIEENRPFFYQMEAQPLRVTEVDEHFAFSATGNAFEDSPLQVAAEEYDWIWLRLPRPIPDGFFDFLLRALPGKTIVNHPAGIALTSNKRFLLEFPDWCPEMRLITRVEDILSIPPTDSFVLKPLENYGGKGVIRLQKGWISMGTRQVMLKNYLPQLEAELSKGGYLAMRYLKKVKRGDKRVVVVNGQIIGAALRIPPKGSWLANAAQGGSAQWAEADEREQAMAAALSERLLPLGIAFFGMDTLTDDLNQRVLSEINTLSIGGIQQMADLSGHPLVEKAIEELMKYINKTASAHG